MSIEKKGKQVETELEKALNEAKMSEKSDKGILERATQLV